MSNVSGNTFWFKNENENMVERFISEEQYSDDKNWEANMYNVPPNALWLAATFASGTNHSNKFQFTVIQSLDPEIFAFTKQFKRKTKSPAHIVVTYKMDGSLTVAERIDEELDARLAELQKLPQLETA